MENGIEGMPRNVAQAVALSTLELLKRSLAKLPTWLELQPAVLYHLVPGYAMLPACYYFPIKPALDKSP